jgi:glucose 1-dehydrogenase
MVSMASQVGRDLRQAVPAFSRSYVASILTVRTGRNNERFREFFKQSQVGIGQRASPAGVCEARRRSHLLSVASRRRSPANSEVTSMDVDDAKFHDPSLPPVVMPACSIEQKLKGQVAIVTGASSGIGRGIAVGLGHAGASVVVNYRSGEEEAVAAVELVKQCGAQAYAHHADVSDEPAVQQMFARARDTFGGIDILVSNAGLQQDAPFDEMTLAQWNKVIAVNLTGQFLCAREAVRAFKRQGNRGVSCASGKIICISSVHDVIPWAGHVNYAASKGGVSLMMKSIAQEVAPYRIRVNAISPGAIRTPINTEAWNTPQAYAELMRLVPYKRIGEVDDIARAAVWLASDDSDYVTGATLYIDGGMTLYPGFEAGG